MGYVTTDGMGGVLDSLKAVYQKAVPLVKDVFGKSDQTAEVNPSVPAPPPPAPPPPPSFMEQYGGYALAAGAALLVLTMMKGKK